MTVNYYYKQTEDGGDSEVQLCTDCVQDLPIEERRQIQWMGAGDEEAICEFCDATPPHMWSVVAEQSQ